MVKFKREQILNDLFPRGDPYSIKKDVLDIGSHGYKQVSNKRWDSSQNLWMILIKSHATDRIFKIRHDITSTTSNALYAAYCKLCGHHVVGSTVCWKPWLSNYKSHISKFKYSCRIVKHFVEVYVDTSLKSLFRFAWCTKQWWQS